MNRSEGLDDHQEFKELPARERVGTLSDSKRLALKRHLKVCASCQQAYEEYGLIGTEGMNFLAAAYGYGHEGEDWDDRPARNELLARIRNGEKPGTAARKADLLHMHHPFVPKGIMVQWAAAALAACVLLAVAVGAYRFGERMAVAHHQPVWPSLARVQDASVEKRASDTLIGLQQARLE